MNIITTKKRPSIDIEAVVGIWDNTNTQNYASSHIQYKSVGKDDIGDDQIDWYHIADNAVDSDQIADYAITGTKIASGAIQSAAMFTTGVVDGNALQHSSVGELHLQNQAVTSTKIADNSVGQVQMSNTSHFGLGATPNEHDHGD